MHSPLRFVPLVMLLACGRSPDDTDSQPVCPRVDSDVATVEWDSVLFESPVTRTITVSNPCDAPYQLDAVRLDGDDVFEVAFEPGELAPGDRAQITVTYQPDGDYGPHAAALFLETSFGEATFPLVGRPDPDQDGDGEDAIEAGGLDCDDLDPRIGQPGPETRNLLDDDCDGTVDEDFIVAGDAWITELMLRPEAVRPNLGQWIEIKNGGNEAIDLLGWELYGAAGTLTVADHVILDPGELAVLAVQTDPAENGGIDVDGALVGDGTPLPDGAWALQLRVGDTVLVALDETSDWPEELGATVALDPLVTDVHAMPDPANWCLGTEELPSEDRGTPGVENTWCPQIDHDGDGYSKTQGDCNDADAEIGRFAPEAWDGKDNDCDGLVDDLFVDQARSGHVWGTRGTQVGARELQVADWNGDGTDEVIASEAGSSGNYAYVLDGWDLHTSGDTPLSDLDYGTFDFGAWGPLGPAPLPGDVDGDGDDDLVFPLSRTSLGEDALWIFDVVPAKGSTLGRANTTLRVTESTGAFQGTVVAHLDLDGNGAVETILGDRRASWGAVTVLDLTDQFGDVDADDVRQSLWSAPERTFVGDHLNGGDLNDDGYDDLLVGEADPYLTGNTVVHTVLGGAELPDKETLAEASTLRLNGHDARLGAGAWILDADGDSRMDLLVGAPADDTVYVIFDAGRLSGSVDVTARADLTIRSSKGLCGTSLDMGDPDRDGMTDLIVGCGSSWTGERGVVMVLPQSVILPGSIDANDASMTLLAREAGDGFGARLRMGDLDGDGARDEMVITAPTWMGTGDWQRGDLWTIERL